MLVIVKSPSSSTPASFTTPNIPNPSNGSSYLAARSAIALPSSRHKAHPDIFLIRNRVENCWGNLDEFVFSGPCHKTAHLAFLLQMQLTHVCLRASATRLMSWYMMPPPQHVVLLRSLPMRMLHLIETQEESAMEQFWLQCIAMWWRWERTCISWSIW